MLAGVYGYIHVHVQTSTCTQKTNISWQPINITFHHVTKYNPLNHNHHVGTHTHTRRHAELPGNHWTPLVLRKEVVISVVIRKRAITLISGRGPSLQSTPISGRGPLQSSQEEGHHYSLHSYPAMQCMNWQHWNYPIAGIFGGYKYSWFSLIKHLPQKFNLTSHACCRKAAIPRKLF